MKTFNTLSKLQEAKLQADQRELVMVKNDPETGESLRFFEITGQVTPYPLANGNYAREVTFSEQASTLSMSAFQDAMFSWWVGPKCLRHSVGLIDKTFHTFCDRNGHSGIAIIDHNADKIDRYILNRQLTTDDHNAGCVAVGDNKVVVVIGGRSNTVEPADDCFVAEWDLDDKPFGPSYSSYFLNVGRDYPNIYQYEDDAILIVSQRGSGLATTGHSFRTNSWPLGFGAASWTPRVDLTDQTEIPDWMYLVTRRDKDDPSIIHMAWGFHPTNVTEGRIFKSEIRHVGGTEPWRLYVDGSEIANMSTGVGLPVSLDDLELIYTPGVDERTRLFDVKKDQVVFARYTDTGDPIPDKTIGEYMFAQKSGGSWSAVKLSDTGKPFLETASTYWSGVGISENGYEVTLGRNVSGFYEFVNLDSDDDGATWNEREVTRFSADSDAGTNAVHGRAIAECPTLETIQANKSIDYQMFGWVGRYSRDSFNKYYTAVLSLAPADISFTLAPSQYQSLCVATDDCDTTGEDCVVLASKNADIVDGEDFQFIAAAEDSTIGSRTRAAIVADSGSSIINRNTFLGGTRNCTFTGELGGDGFTSYWLMGALGSEGCTAGKTHTVFLGSTSSDLGTGNTQNVTHAAAIASNSITSGPEDTFISAMASDGCFLGGKYVAVLASENCDSDLASNERYSFIAASSESDTTESRNVILGSDASTTTVNGAHVFASRSVQNDTDYSIAGGYDLSGTPSTANQTWRFESETGDGYMSGTLAQNHTFADIAKMMKNGEGLEIEAGYLLSIFGDKVFKSRQGEPVDAIVAATPSMIHNDTPFHWQGRYELDEFGRKVTVETDMIKWTGYDGPVEGKALPSNAELYDKDMGDDILVPSAKVAPYDGLLSNAPEVPEWAERYKKHLPLENPNYDPKAEQTPRSQRPDEWTMAGVHGMVRTRVDQTVTQSAVDSASENRQNCYIETGETDGIGTLATGQTNVKVMSVEREYDTDKGYGVALCFLT